jgi:elongation factor G
VASLTTSGLTAAGPPAVGVTTAGIRNVALVGHHGAGKTTLAEALLAVTGAISRQGTIERGNTVCDTDPESVSRHLSVGLAVAPFFLDGVKVNVVDTPGYPDFDADLHTALRIADLAVVVVSATDGVAAQTEEAWAAAAALNLPRVVVINKLDRERADFDAVLEQVRAAFGAGVAPVELPVGQEAGFRGVIDLLDDRATLYDLGQGPPVTGVEGPIPEDLVVSEHQIHEQLVEGIVVGDDDLMTRYLDGEAIDRAELEASLAGGVAAAAVFPVLCVSGATGVGVDRLARLLVELCPSPDQRPPAHIYFGGPNNRQSGGGKDGRRDSHRGDEHSSPSGRRTMDVPCDPEGKPLAVIVKTLPDPHAGRLSVGKVLSGTLHRDMVLTNSRTRGDERLHALGTLRGRELQPVEEVVAGDLFAVPRLSATSTGDTLAPKDMPVTVDWPSPPPANLAIAVRPASRLDDDKLMAGLHRLCEEDEALTVRRVDEAHQTVLGVTGDVHLAVTLERLQRRFGVSVESEELAVPYRETITRPAAAEGRHKKQSGGHGQFAVCHLRLEPLARGGGFAFDDAVVGGAIPRQYIPAVERGAIEAMAGGGPYGYPVVDVAVTVDDGRHHPVDSSELAFKTAGSLAFRQAMAEADPVLLEPISLVEVRVPTTRQGEVLGDLTARRGRIVGTEADGDGRQLLRALVPDAELVRYAVDLRALTGGRGHFTVTHDHYDVVPEHLVASVPRPAP